MDKISKYNFYTKTVADFKGCKKPKRTPDYISKSGSQYWYGEDKKGHYVIRYSNHWSCKNIYNISVDNKRNNVYSKNGRAVSSCVWRIITNRFCYTVGYAGKAYFKNFKNIKIHN
ncbi:MAG: hypothetical protein LBS23_02020 [Holosporaceae bacterium]|jgi:hypothetical protein|nr:hypothetical protein [Holosporaceae bacterium]